MTDELQTLRDENAQLTRDLDVVRRIFLEYVRASARRRANRGLGGAYSRELTDSLREYIDAVGDDAAWHGFLDIRDSLGGGELAHRLLTLHYADAWCDSLADEIRGDISVLSDEGGA